MNFNIKHDLDLLTKSPAEISIGDVVGLLERKKVYKQSGSEEYQDFRAKIKALKIAKLPFRITGFDKKTLIAMALPYEKSLQILERINFLHGTNSALLPMIHDTLEMIPTGRLLDRGRAPMGGEISLGGLEVHGINQHTLSADTIRNISRCWEYASKTSNSFDPTKYSNPEELFLKILEELSNTSPDNNEWDCHIVTLLRLKQWNPDAFIELCQKHREKIELCKETTKGRFLNKGELQALKWMKTDIEAKKEDLIPEYIRDEFPSATCAHKTWKDAFSNDNHLATLFESFNSHMYDTHEVGWKLLLVKLFAKDMMLKLESREAKEGFKYYGVKISKLCSGDHSLIYQKLVVEKMDAWVRKKMASYQKRYDRLITLFDTAPNIRFTQQDREMIEKPFGILFASTLAKATESYSREEVNFDRAKLGSEIDLAFVTQDNLEKMNQWVNEHGLRVKVLDSSLITTLPDFPLHHAPDQVQNSSSLFDKRNVDRLNRILNESVFPLYKVPYSNGESRVHHGVPHSARTVLFAQVLMEMSGNVFKHNIIGTLVAMGLHDGARLDDGEDLWDTESGQLAKQILMKEFKLTEEEASFFATCIANKDKVATSDEQRIIHDGDCLEIMRCLRNPLDFKSSELRMKVDEEFIQEARLLIQLTEKEIIKTFIENSPNPYQTLVQIISYSYEQKGLFHQIFQHIQPAISALAHPSVYQLTSEIENLCKQ